MNDNNNFYFNSNSNTVEPSAQQQTQSQNDLPYASYYNHKDKKSAWPAIIIIVLLAGVTFGVLWYVGFFKPVDKQAEYNKLYSRVCSAAVDYADSNYIDEKSIEGKIVYVTIAKLANANLIESTIVNSITDTIIPTKTNIRLEVLPSGDFECHGFLYKGDDKTKPSIILKGESIITASIGSVLTDPGFVATDDKDGDITDSVVRSGNVETGKTGTYIITYIVSDISGNLSDPIIRTYIIK